MSVSSRNATVFACSAVSAVLGTVHAFSVFVPQWERLEGIGRAEVSLVYSAALVSLTIAVLLGYRLYRVFSPFVLFALVGVLAALGLALSSFAQSANALYISYGVIFGGANGLGYGYALQLSSQAAPHNRGLAMGLVTAFYAVGATVAPIPFVYLINLGGNALALQVIGALVLVVSLMSAVLVRHFGASYESEQPSDIQTMSSSQRRSRLLLWVAYGGAVAAGLMIIGHAFGLAVWLELDKSAATWAATSVVLGNMMGGFSAGVFADRLSSKAVLTWLPLFSVVGLTGLLSANTVATFLVFVSLGLLGYCYGAIIAVFPVLVSDVFGTLAAPRIYGQVFTAWGVAGLLGPWLSGWMFDQTSSYTAALILAMALSALSIVAFRLAIPK